MLEAQVADADDCVSRFLGREGPRPNGAPRHQRIGEEPQLSTPSEERAVIHLADVLHQWPYARETRMFGLRPFKERSGPLRDNARRAHRARIGQQVDDGGNELGDGFACRRRLPRKA